MRAHDARRDARPDIKKAVHRLINEFSDQHPAGAVIAEVVKAREMLLAHGVRQGLAAATEAFAHLRLRTHIAAVRGRHTEHQRRILSAFVALADTLVDDYEMLDLLQELVEQCVRVLPAKAAVLLLADQRDVLHPVVSTTNAASLRTVFESGDDRSPCRECVDSGAPVLVPDLTAESDRWPQFATLARAADYRSVHVLPLRLGEQTFGVITLFHAHAPLLSHEDLHLGQALADLATIGILQERMIHREQNLPDEVQAAFEHRALIDRATAALIARDAIDPDTAFTELRRYARNRNRPLAHVAADVLDHGIEIADRAAG
jgi:transcriptional regulator with GAF, ATPase, and Fis domain